ncbi:hypothetical protein [Solidesulfovibrio alcoholivorans]|uniref:hypothetical protein n=1 Tax=Solidesulfovibrio alcoholivorans TaxID=81406 RepID=UPI0012EC87C6|nr:hypothetical protein [Solidesulfovibrio alcoholivorans]
MKDTAPYSRILGWIVPWFVAGVEGDIGFHGATGVHHGTGQGVAPLAKSRIAGALKA